MLALGLPRHLAIPLHAAALQRRENMLIGASHIAVAVQILNPHQPLAVVHLGVEVAGHGSDEGTLMQWTGRRGREAADVRLGRRHARSIQCSRGAAAAPITSMDYQN